MIKRPLLAVTTVLLSVVFLNACQTTAPDVGKPNPTPVQSTKSAETKIVEPVKSIAKDTARALANNCFTCHGPNGRSPGTIPSLTNLSADEIAARLKNFKSGAAASTVMGRHAKAYSDSEIDAVSKYIAGLKR